MWDASPFLAGRAPYWRPAKPGWRWLLTLPSNVPHLLLQQRRIRLLTHHRGCRIEIHHERGFNVYSVSQAGKELLAGFAHAETETQEAIAARLEARISELLKLPKIPVSAMRKGRA
jgi:hypothetical protein